MSIRKREIRGRETVGGGKEREGREEGKRKRNYRNIRIGTPAVTTRGMKETDMIKIANFIDRTLSNYDSIQELGIIKEEVIKFLEDFPI